MLLAGGLRQSSLLGDEENRERENLEDGRVYVMTICMEDMLAYTR